MSTTTNPYATLRIPAQIAENFEVTMPGNMSINCEAPEANRATAIGNDLNRLFTFYDDTHISLPNDLLVLSLPHGKSKREIMAEIPSKLLAGRGLETNRYQPTVDALLVGPERRSIRNETAIWLGRALGSPNVTRVFLLGSNFQQIPHLLEQDKIVAIDDPLDCVRVKPRQGTIDFGLVAMMKQLGINRAEAIK